MSKLDDLLAEALDVLRREIPKPAKRTIGRAKKRMVEATLKGKFK